MKAKLLALLLTILAFTQPANALITNQTWVGYFAGEFFTFHCQGRNTQYIDWVYWLDYEVACVGEVVWTGYWDIRVGSAGPAVVPVNATSVLNAVMTAPFVCPALFASTSTVGATLKSNGEIYSTQNYDSDEINQFNCSGGGN